MALSSHVCTLCLAETFFRHHSTEVEMPKKERNQCNPMDFRLATISKITQNFSPCHGTCPPAPLSHSFTAKSLISHGVSQPRPPRQMARAVRPCVCRTAAGCAASDPAPDPPLLCGRWPKILLSSARSVWGESSSCVAAHSSAVRWFRIGSK